MGLANAGASQGEAGDLPSKMTTADQGPRCPPAIAIYRQTILDRYIRTRPKTGLAPERRATYGIADKSTTDAAATMPTAAAFMRLVSIIAPMNDSGADGGPAPARLSGQAPSGGFDCGIDGTPTAHRILDPCAKVLLRFFRRRGR